MLHIESILGKIYSKSPFNDLDILFYVQEMFFQKKIEYVFMISLDTEFGKIS